MAHAKKNTLNQGGAERRRSPRHRLCLDAEVQTPAGRAEPVVVHELSRFGCLMESCAPVPVGELLQLRLPPSGSVEARVIWCCGSHMGCAFQRELSSAALSAALLKARPAREGEELPRRLRVQASNCGQRASTNETSSRRRQLPLIFGISVLLWSALAAALLFSIS